jgi:UDP-glucuronate 4-epimerase
MRFLITGSAGFIGFHLARRLLADGHEVHGFDGLTDYYDPRLKVARHAELAKAGGFAAHIGRLENEAEIVAAAAAANPDVIVHLAAQAGVRFSRESPRTYVDANLIGTFNVLEVARKAGVSHLILGSTSSVYGAGVEMPFRETARTDYPLSFYGATKKATELLGHSHAHNFGIPVTATRFFTVYGPWGRPDMALFSFVDAILDGRPINLYGEGNLSRDFTYVADVVEAVARLIPLAPKTGQPVGDRDSLSPVAPFRAVNIGNGAPVALPDFVRAIEQEVGRRAMLNLMPRQPGDAVDTFADTSLLQRLTGFRPRTAIGDGVAAFVDWYRGFYGK